MGASLGEQSALGAISVRRRGSVAPHDPPRGKSGGHKLTRDFGAWFQRARRIPREGIGVRLPTTARRAHHAHDHVELGCWLE
jgi:hypothetical protein